MKVLHLNTVTGGGSAKGSMRMHKALLKHGVDSWMMTLEEYADDQPNHKVYQQYFKGILDKVKFKIKQRRYYSKYRYIRGNKNTGVTFSFPETYYDITAHPLYKEADVIHLHWVARWLDYPSFFAKCDKPIVWTIRDRAVFSSGFHVGIENDSFIEEASDFPKNLKEFAEYKFLKDNLEIKKKALNAFSKDKILIAPKSKWMAEHAKKSAVLGALNHEMITNCIDPEEIYRKDKEESRKSLGLPLDKKLVLFVSSGLYVSYKGFQYLEPLIKLQFIGDLPLPLGSSYIEQCIPKTP